MKNDIFSLITTTPYCNFVAHTPLFRIHEGVMFGTRADYPYAVTFTIPQNLFF